VAPLLISIRLRNVWLQVSASQSQALISADQHTAATMASAVAVPVEKKEEPSITIVTPPHPRHSRSYLPSWTQFGIISALVGILSVVLVYLPSLSLNALELIVVQRQNKLWGKLSNETIVPLGNDVCRRVPGMLLVVASFGERRGADLRTVVL
jgi:hypothetical protein